MLKEGGRCFIVVVTVVGFVYLNLVGIIFVCLKNGDHGQIFGVKDATRKHL